MSLSASRQEIEVCWFSLAPAAQEVERLASFLDASERLRVSRFATDVLRRRFIVAHGRVRELLGKATGLAPESVLFEVGPYGKPQLTATPAGCPRFNLSHSDDLGVLAFSFQVEVGVDLEMLRPVPDAQQLVADHFCAWDQEWFGRLPEDRKSAGFLSLWTRREAVAKAIGCGLLEDLRDLAVAGDGPSAILHDNERWVVRELALPGTVLTLCHLGNEPLPVRVRQVFSG